ncbi:hypothetical protein SERLADRAFT_462668 [Serpula lacrymans var. lacrymans S7.9]|uniref:RRM domain-containing protein n=1 Tax=Serpula lacrymans var. lacrymans (strain S7.9) TaxID=578457 RepID=F8NPD4_SERL9|nr:uncharacterized protein SERLADRAFT_462668 [Serpula lacrymans var. lacrymans S7.9]EGO28126.1 hypothetical protein SERLADRAFT_462668 [Serpula lacrymans var. lacrymans S7.9]
MQGGLLSPTTGSMSVPGLGAGIGEGGSAGTSPMLGNGYGGIISHAPRDDYSNMNMNGQENGGTSIGPWDLPSPREREDSMAHQSLSSLSFGLSGSRMSSVVPIARPPSSSRISHDSPPDSAAFSPTMNDSVMLPPHRSAPFRRPISPAGPGSLQVQLSHPPSSASSSTGPGLEGERAAPLAVSTAEQQKVNNAGNTSPQLPSPASNSGSAVSSSIGGGGVGGSSGTGSVTSHGAASHSVGANGPRNTVIDQNPPINTLYVGNLPTVGGGYPSGYLEEALRDLFSRRSGYRKLCFRQKSNGPMCFVEFEDVSFATKALNELYGNTLSGLVKNGGIRLSYSKNPLGVRTPTSAGNGSTSLQQQQQQHQSIVSPFPSEPFPPRHAFDADPNRSSILRRDSSTAMSSPIPSAFAYFSPSPPSSATFGSLSTATTLPASSATFPRGSGSFALSSSNGNGTTSSFSPFGMPLSSNPSTNMPGHSTIPEQISPDVERQHFSHRTLSPHSSALEAARAG